MTGRLGQFMSLFLDFSLLVLELPTVQLNQKSSANKSLHFSQETLKKY